MRARTIALPMLPLTLALAACGGETNEIPVTNTANVVPPNVDGNVAFRNDEPPEVIEERALNQDDALAPVTTVDVAPDPATAQNIVVEDAATNRR